MSLYDGPVIDAHHHLWDYGMGRHPWLSPSGGTPLSGMELLQRDYLAPEYADDMADADVVATVHVEALWDSTDPLGETQWLNGLDRSGGIDGLAEVYVAAAPLALHTGPQMVEAQAAHPRVRGIRAVLSHHPDPGRSFVSDPDLAATPAFRDSLAVMQDRGLVLDVTAFPWQADHLCRLARDFPRLQMVLNHCGSPVDQDMDGIARWRGMLMHLGQLPNVAVKLANAGLYGEGSAEERARRDVLACLSAFGADRCLFGTDVPVSLRHRPASETLRLVAQAVHDLSADEQTQVFEGAARRIYGI